jgi:ribosome maturation factor RimP
VTDKAVEIAALLSPTVASLGVELMGVEYLPSPGGAVLRLYIDVPAGDVPAGEAPTDESAEPRAVTIEECEAVSREVSAQLDVEDPITGHYTLEVSSPGIDRPLFNAQQFARFAGESAKVTLKLPQDGRRRFQARIARVEGEVITFQLEGSGGVPVELIVRSDNIDKARLVPDWAALGFAPTKDKPGRGARPGKKNPTKKPAAEMPSAESEK